MAVLLISAPANLDENSMMALVSHATDIAEEDMEVEDELLGGDQDDEEEELFRDHNTSENRMSTASSNHSNLNVTLGHPQVHVELCHFMLC